MMIKAMVLFLAAGLAEIGGGYLIWLWLRESKPIWVGVLGGIILVLYGIIPTLQSFPNFGRDMPPTAGSLLFWRSSGDGSWTGKRPISTTGSER